MPAVLGYLEDWLDSLGGAVESYGEARPTSPAPSQVDCGLLVDGIAVVFGESDSRLEVQLILDQIERPLYMPFSYRFDFRTVSSRELIWRHDMHEGHTDLYARALPTERYAECHYHSGNDQGREPLEDPPITLAEIFDLVTTDNDGRAGR